MDILSWHNLIFYVSIAFGLVVGLGSAFGGHGGDADGDADADAEADADGDADHDADAGHDAAHSLEVAGQVAPRRASLGRLVLRMLGVGKAPIAVMLMTFFLVYGFAGIILNQLLARVMPQGFAWLSLGLAFVIASVLTRFIAGAIHRVMPTFETYSVSSRDLVGRMGTLILPADARNGTAQVHDHEGNIHQIACRTDGPAIPKGTSVLIVQYVSEGDTYLVERNPLADKGDS